MALRALMLRRSIDNKKKELEQLREKEAALLKREKELEDAIEEAKDEEEQRAVEDEVEKYEEDKSAFEKAKEECVAAIDKLEKELTDIEEEAPKNEPTPMTTIVDENERSKRTRMININIRALPKEQRVFDALPMQTRQEIIAREDVKAFLKELRSMKGGAQRAVSGADLTIPIVFLDLISENMFRYSKLLNRVRVRNVNGEARQTIAGRR